MTPGLTPFPPFHLSTSPVNLSTKVKPLPNKSKKVKKGLSGFDSDYAVKRLRSLILLALPVALRR